MAFRQVRQHAPFEGVGVGQKATVAIPATGRIYTLFFRFLTSGGALITRTQLENDVTLLDIVVDGKTYITGTGEFLTDLSEYYYEQRGYDNIDGQLAINLSRDFFSNSIQGDVFAWGMSDISNVRAEISLNATSITTATIETYAEMDNFVAVLGDHVRLERFSQNHGSASEDSVSDLPLVPGAVDQAIHIFFDDNTSDLDDVTLTINSTDMIQLTGDINRAIQEKAGRTLQIDASGNSTFTIDFNLMNDIRGGLSHTDTNGNLLTDFRVRPTFSTAAPGDYTIYRETVYKGK